MARIVAPASLMCPASIVETSGPCQGQQRYVNRFRARRCPSIALSLRISPVGGTGAMRSTKILTRGGSEFLRFLRLLRAFLRCRHPWFSATDSTYATRVIVDHMTHSTPRHVNVSLVTAVRAKWIASTMIKVNAGLEASIRRFLGDLRVIGEGKSRKSRKSRKSFSPGSLRFFPLHRGQCPGPAAITAGSFARHDPFRAPRTHERALAVSVGLCLGQHRSGWSRSRRECFAQPGPRRSQLAGSALLLGLLTGPQQLGSRPPRFSVPGDPRHA